ncbi:uroporphyrinogen-III C-methyltransferase [Halomonas garicola]|uniref:uroporphyrinogen-III C-methyltransferase n=1 Tax=Halomonas garicola TaxID=1690008 RepID=UPI00289A66B1|nr:uroporphyrinogen-III C-methyltransferase [Halomonas garicola]
MALLDRISRQPRGSVSLVGAGPGDPELLTLKAYQRLLNADIVLHDRLVSEEVLALIPAGARKRYVGKACSHHSVPQEGISRALVDWALEGHAVVRLKGGDPFIFGRGGEELETLMARRIPVEVIPGITAASGCASYAGIPLTHRDYAQSVRLVTGHVKSGRCELDWTSLARPGQTLVFYMGLGNLETICAALRAHGLAATTPLALVSQGTTRDQAVHIGRLAALPEEYLAGTVKTPTLLIIGEVVGVNHTLDWFDAKSGRAGGFLPGKPSASLRPAPPLRSFG